MTILSRRSLWVHVALWADCAGVSHFMACHSCRIVSSSTLRRSRTPRRWLVRLLPACACRQDQYFTRLGVRRNCSRRALYMCPYAARKAGQQTSKLNVPAAARFVKAALGSGARLAQDDAPDGSGSQDTATAGAGSRPQGWWASCGSVSLAAQGVYTTVDAATPKRRKQGSSRGSSGKAAKKRRKGRKG